MGLNQAMQPGSLVTLVSGGNSATVEEEWMRLVESPDTQPFDLATYGSVLEELRRTGETALAETLAWATIEAIRGRYSDLEALTVARPFLLAVGDSKDLRAQVTDLYRSAYSGRDGLEGLISESGIGGGRPVRRALRILELCLAVSEGDYLVERDGDGAARVEKTEMGSWKFSLSDSDGVTGTLDAVHLADQYEAAAPTDFRVLRDFAPDTLAKILNDDPVSVVIDICREHGNRIDTDTLEESLVPRVIAEDQWKKWWTRARNALKRCPNIKIDGRSPCYVSFSEEVIAPEEAFLAEFNKLRDPLEQLARVEEYIRDCKAHKHPPSAEALGRCYERCRDRAQRQAEQGTAASVVLCLVAQRVGQTAGAEGASDGTITLLQAASDLVSLISSIESEPLVDAALECLPAARPQDWQEPLLELLPDLPTASCDRAISLLVEAGRNQSDFEPVVQRIIASPVAHFGALLWLWTGPSNEGDVCTVPPVTILGRILRGLVECRIADDVSKEKVKTMRLRARAVLSARRYERFKRCLDGLEQQMARALRTQIGRSDMLGRNIREDFLIEIDRRFPVIDTEPEVPPWAREDVLYVTAMGLSRKHAEVDEHINVKMKENARAIGQAAEHGDLSENSEYKFALEERDLLRARLAQMNAELALAQVFAPEDVPTDHIGVGTRVVFRRTDDGACYEMEFVGPWDADLPQGRYNYKAPLAQQLMGKRVGDSVEFNHSGAAGTYEILELHNALTE